MIALKIDGKKVKVPEGTTVLQAAQQAGVEIPHLCHHEGILPYGACRVCTVEITKDGRTRLQASCTYPVEEGLEVKTDTPRVQEGRKIILEFLLARCPDSEPIREFARRWGVSKTRFEKQEKDDCILCGLCVRACSQVVGAEAVGFSGRGLARKVDTPFGYHPDSCVGCGLCTYVCPTGHIQMEAETARKLRQSVGTERTCRYMLMGLVSEKTCPQNFECWHCPYDQYMEYALKNHPALLARRADSQDQVSVGPFHLKPDRSYAGNHVWYRRYDGHWMVGVDHFLCSLLGPVDQADVSAGRILLASGDRRLELPLAVGGEVVKLNPDIQVVPRLVNFSPYQRGWLAILQADQAGSEELMGGKYAVAWMHREVARLEEATGLRGEKLTVPDARRNWDKLEKRFFGDEEGKERRDG
jgi:bidirectional [NiFe] hydrogenase diaphorase subunit